MNTEDIMRNTIENIHKMFCKENNIPYREPRKNHVNLPDVTEEDKKRQEYIDWVDRFNKRTNRKKPTFRHWEE